MADVKTEVQSIRDFVAPELPGATFKLQHMPDAYKTNELAIELAPSSSTNETRAHYRLNRVYQLAYFGTSKLDCVTKMQELERKFNDKQMIQLGTTGRYLRISSFSLSQSFKTETTGVYAIIGMLEAELRETRTQPQYEKINSVGVTTYTDGTARTWGVIDGTGTPANPNDGFTWDDIESGKTILDKE